MTFTGDHMFVATIVGMLFGMWITYKTFGPGQ